ncbi:GntR family transcriptional regulator [Cryobacterium sp. M91]|uniref:GntR family transcriptional regulator n=1 Tax=Cryobacterium sp. M91 TaxID=2048294 RepID=UPI000CE2C63F|nr:GntR family transcriptional regulator [Cryobacterium sp. M91]
MAATEKRRMQSRTGLLVAEFSNRIRHGEWAGLEKLPTEQDLCAEFGVSRVTIRLALNSLEARGLVVSKQGKGTYILRRTPGVRAGLQELTSISATIKEMGLEPSTIYKMKQVRASSSEEANSFDLEHGSSVLDIQRTIKADGKPAAYVDDVMPLWVFGAHFSPSSLTGSVFDYLHKHTSVQPRYAVAHVKARNTLPDRWVGEHSLVAPGGPFLLLDQMQFDVDDRPFMHTRVHFVDNNFDFMVLRVV